MQHKLVWLLVCFVAVAVVLKMQDAGTGILLKELETNPAKRDRWEKIKQLMLLKIGEDSKKSRPEMVQGIEMIIAQNFPKEYRAIRGDISGAIHQSFWLVESGNGVADSSNAQIKHLLKSTQLPADYFSKSATKLA